MDGTVAKDIIESSTISAITLDRKATRIYWANDLSSIETSDYEGQGRLTVTSIPMSVASLAVFEGQLFWTRSTNWTDICPCTNILWSCSMHRRICSNVTSHRLSFDHPGIIRTPYDHERHLTTNPCAQANGGCQHLCLMTSRGSHDCACGIGWRLNPDRKTCSRVTELMVYVRGSYVRGRVLDVDGESFTEAFLPTRFQADGFTPEDFDYDMIGGQFLFSDGVGIFKISVMKDDEQMEIFSVDKKDHKITDIAYDWTKRYVYYIKQTQNPSGNHSIGVFSIEPGNKLQKTLTTWQYNDAPYIDCPFLLTIHPAHEYLFYTTYRGSTDNLERIGTNGKGSILLKILQNDAYSILAIDLEASRLYYAKLMSKSDLIESTNMDGTDDKLMEEQVMVKPKFLGVQGNWVYFGNHTEIWRMNKEIGHENATKIVGSRYYNDKPVGSYLRGLKVFNLAARNDN